jgi:hypothetical protein
MSKHKCTAFCGCALLRAIQGQAPARVAAVQERKRSNAAGPHGKPYNRSAEKRAAMKDQT